MPPVLALSLLFNTVVSPVYSSTELVSRYIDDQLGDLVTEEMPAQQAFNRTWHYASQHGVDAPRMVTLNFEGIALDVYCIMPNPVNAPQTISSYFLTFVLDGQLSDQSGSFQFNVSVLSLNNMIQDHHELAMTAIQGVNSTIMFDYARYISSTSSTSSASQSPSTGPPTAIIVDGVVSGSVFGSFVTLVVAFQKEYFKHSADLTIARPAFLEVSSATQPSRLTTRSKKLSQMFLGNSVPTTNRGRSPGVRKPCTRKSAS
ncbi:hypothetical protein GYMLUDRAFT_70639 [Collybiopsis luxurians FD-317 M1]|nr:hypothetical protein GYMLUDRAFT_70639 [Collybiopsis luxurians FD-317 M1]